MIFWSISGSEYIVKKDAILGLIHDIVDNHYEVILQFSKVLINKTTYDGICKACFNEIYEARNANETTDEARNNNDAE